jgi:hypothetical protein
VAVELAERVAALARDHTGIKRKLAEVGGQFEFISGQLRAVQVYVRNRFDQVEARLARAAGASSLDQVGSRLDRLDMGMLEVKGELVVLRRVSCRGTRYRSPSSETPRWRACLKKSRVEKS